MSIRPRFRLEVPFDSREVHQRFQSRLACQGCPCSASVVGDHVEVMVRNDLRHFWSPRLSLEIESKDNGAALYGLYGPNPNVWTMFLAAYAFLILTATFSGVLGFVQLALDQTAWGLWVMAGSLIACVGPYVGSQIGQRLAAEQMELLSCFLQEALGLSHPHGAPSDACPPTTPQGRSLPVVEAP